jgi:hypothetical protein
LGFLFKFVPPVRDKYRQEEGMVPKESLMYKSGDIWLPKSIVEYLHTYVIGNDRTLFYINYWHGMHLLSGVLFGLFSLFIYHIQSPMYTYILLHTSWEFWQMYIGMTKTNLRGLIDISIDTLMGLFGLYLVL